MKDAVSSQTIKKILGRRISDSKAISEIIAEIRMAGNPMKKIPPQVERRILRALSEPGSRVVLRRTATGIGLMSFDGYKNLCDNASKARASKVQQKVA